MERCGELDRHVVARHPGCSSFGYTERNYEPLIRTCSISSGNEGPADVHFDDPIAASFRFLVRLLRAALGGQRRPPGPEPHPQLQGIMLRNLSWRGRRFTVSVGRRFMSGRSSPGGRSRSEPSAGYGWLRPAAALSIARPPADLRRTSDAVDCQPAKASNAEPARLPWPPSTATRRPMAGRASPGHVYHTAARRSSDHRPRNGLWGRLWPGVEQPDVPRAPGPVKTLGASSYTVQVWQWPRLADGGEVRGVTKRITDVLRFGPVRARFIRLRLTKRSQKPLRPTKTT